MSKNRFQMSPPQFTIIIPTIGDPDKLARTVESVLQCEGPPFEIVVVDQRRDDWILRRIRGINDRRIRHVKRDSPGRNAEMNHGAGLARGEVLVFTDDDIIVRPDWLRNAAAHLAGAEDLDGIVGRILPYGGPPGADHLAPQSVEWSEGRLLSPLGLLKGFGANTFYRRAAFARAGGYDPRMGVGGQVGGSGDWEMLYRVIMRAGRMKYCPDVVVWHDGWETRAARARKAYVYDRARMAAHIKCWFEVGGPALRDMTALTLRFFFDGVKHLAHRRRGTAWSSFVKFAHYRSGVPLGLSLALGRRSGHR